MLATASAPVHAVPGIFLHLPREYRKMVPLRLLIEHLRAQATVRAYESSQHTARSGGDLLPDVTRR